MIRLLCKPKTELFKINHNSLQIIKLFPYKVCLLNVLNRYMAPINLWKGKELLGGIPAKAIYIIKKLLHSEKREYTRNIQGWELNY